MSRIGKQAITIPEKVDVTVADDGTVTVKGPRGEFSRRFLTDISISVSDGTVTLKPLSKGTRTQALWGTYASHVANMIHGVTEGYTKRLVVEGVGFKVAVEGNKLVLNIGFSHPVSLAVPEGIEATVEKDTIILSGIDKEQVGEFAATVRAQKPAEPYKGKGIRYEDEIVRRKQGKRAVSAAA